jgi:hypothetical protein
MVWTVTPSGKNIELYQPAPATWKYRNDEYTYSGSSGGEIFIGWIDAHTFVTYSINVIYGPYNLRSFNIETGEIAIFWQSSFDYLIGQDLASATFIIAVSDRPDFDTDIEPGIFILSHGKTTYLAEYLEKAGTSAIWVPDLGFYFLDTRKPPLRPFRQDASWVDLPAFVSFIPKFVLDNGMWVSQFGEFLDFPKGILVQPVQNVDAIERIPGTDNFLICAAGEIYQVIAPDYHVVDVGESKGDCRDMKLVLP